MKYSIERLNKILAADNGFYILALHSFIEGYLKDTFNLRGELNFYQTISYYQDKLFHERNPRYKNYIFRDLKDYHIDTNLVRHSFIEINDEISKINTSLFIQFCNISNAISQKELAEFNHIFKNWDERTVITDLNMIKKMSYQIAQLEQDTQNNLLLHKEYSQLKESSLQKDKELKEIQNNLSYYESKAHENKEKTDQLRKEKNEVQMNLKELEANLKQFENWDKYLAYLSRFTAYTRTRRDYEHFFFKLSKEQEEAIKKLKLEKNYLIKGSAGSGKSIVLIHALKWAISELKNELSTDKGEIRLLTYTKTLVKYNQYVTEVLGIPNSSDYISSVHSFIHNLFSTVFPDWNIFFSTEGYKKLFASLELPDFINQTELISEIDSFIYSNIITEDEYLNDMIPRKGMKKALTKEKRQIIWDFKTQLEDLMNANKSISLLYSHTKLLDYYLNSKDPDQIDVLSHLLIDESQDLHAVTLALLRRITTDSMILAGDNDQSLYNHYSPYKRAGIDISRKTTILHTSFRNTVQNLKFSDAFRTKQIGNFDIDYSSTGYREGPYPEIIQSGKDKSVSTLLIEKLKIFINDLHYDPENICILVESEKMGFSIAKKIKQATSLDTDIIVNDKDFNFNTKGNLRCCTLHSSKGLDFPVVFIYLPYISKIGNESDETWDKTLRNLLFVGITRAIDSLTIFIEDISNPVIKDLYDAWKSIL